MTTTSDKGREVCEMLDGDWCWKFDRHIGFDPTCVIYVADGDSRPPTITQRRGVYVLISEGIVVYAGLTADVVRRVKEHRRDKTFDAFVFWPLELSAVSRVRLEALESALIWFCRPKYNVAYPEDVYGNAF